MVETKKKIEKFGWKRFWVIALNCFLVILMVVGLGIAFSLLPIKGNYSIFSVMSGSMEPTISTGSVVIVKPLDESRYEVGDIITFLPAEAKASKDKVTHRIYKLESKETGKFFITKGDANDVPDANLVNPDRIVGKVYFNVPLLGYLFGYIKTLPGLVLLIIIPATIIVYEEVRKIHREAKKIIESRRAKDTGKKTKGSSKAK